MAANRCTTCVINYPSYYTKCYICDEKTDYISNAEPHEDWKERVDALKARLAEAARLQETIPQVDADRVPVKVRDGQYFIHYWDLYAAGMKDKPQPSDLIQVGKQVFEVLEWVQPQREFLVRPFSTTVCDEDLERWLRVTT